MESGSFFSSGTNSTHEDLWVDLCPGKRLEDMLVLARLPSDPLPLFLQRLPPFPLSASSLSDT